MASKTGACFPIGFKASGVSAGIKPSGKSDVSLLYSESPCSAAGVFTKNLAKASPVLISEKHLSESGSAQAIVFSSGNANAANGPAGDEVSLAMCEAAAESLNLPIEQVLIAQTGLIGIPLNSEVACKGVKLAASSLKEEGGSEAAAAMMTTDTFAKESSVEIELDGELVKVGGMAKGAAMLAPSMATMLAVVTTDAKLSSSLAHEILASAMEDSFHSMIVDGCMSTNDTVFLLANGFSSAAEVTKGSDSFVKLQEAVTKVCSDLAKQMAEDGEGSSKFLTMKVAGAASKEDARLAARAVVGSVLVKCSLAGEVQYWGRIIAELGASGASFDPRAVEIFYGEQKVCDKGIACKHDQKSMDSYMLNSKIEISANLHAGDQSAEAYGCDLSHAYVDENMGRS